MARGCWLNLQDDVLFVDNRLSFFIWTFQLLLLLLLVLLVLLSRMKSIILILWVIIWKWPLSWVLPLMMMVMLRSQPSAVLIFNKDAANINRRFLIIVVRRLSVRLWFLPTILKEVNEVINNRLFNRDQLVDRMVCVIQSSLFRKSVLWDNFKGLLQLFLFGDLIPQTFERSMRKRLVFFLFKNGFSLVFVRGCRIAIIGIVATLQIHSCACYPIQHLPITDNRLMLWLLTSISMTLDLLSHNVNVLLSLLNHNQCLVPFFLKLFLRFLNLIPLQSDPTLKLFLLQRISPWWELPLLVHLLDVAPFLFLSVVNCFLPRFNHLHEFVVQRDVVQLLRRELLEAVPVKETLVRLALACLSMGLELNTSLLMLKLKWLKEVILVI